MCHRARPFSSHPFQGKVEAANDLLGPEKKDESETRRLVRAHVEALQGNISSAVARMTTIVQTAPKKSYQPRVQLGEWQLALGETDLVTQHAERLIDHASPEARWNGWLLKGRALWHKGYLTDAATALDQAVAMAPQRTRSRLLRARLAFAQHDANSLNSHIAALEKSAPHTTSLGVLKGYAAGMAGDIDAALAAWKTQAETFPTDFEGLYTAGVFLQEKGRLTDAVALLEEAHKRAPGHVGIANNLTMALSESNPKRAAALIKPFATQQDHPYLWDSYGWALFHGGDLDEAEKWVLKARAAMP